jgi:hypothetical protein
MEGTTIPLRRIIRDSRIKPVSTKHPLTIPLAGDDFPKPTSTFDYGRFTFDHVVNFVGLSISLEQTQELHHYHRAIGNWILETDIFAPNGRMSIHPVKPLHIPHAITDFLEIRFDEIMIEPNGKIVLFLTFPIEIGVFIESKGKSDVIDIFTFKQPKYSLYGVLNRGIITRWHQSKTYYYPPQVKNYEEGILRLTVKNNSDDWTHLSRTVLYEKGMHIYYDNHIVSMTVDMNISSRDTADVIGVNLPLRENMTRSLQMCRPQRTTTFTNIPGTVVDAIFTMDSGLI